MEQILFIDGNAIPAVGFGVYLIPNDGSTYKAVSEALKAGYRHIDTAAAYFNEAEVGQAIADSGIDRKDIFVTSKLWIQDFGYEAAKKGLETSLKKLGLDYIDLYLLHQPFGDIAGAWKALEEGKRDGKIKSIGVSNMTPNIWNKYVPDFETVPAVNQIEFNPYSQQKEIREIMSADDVKVEAWGPLGQGSKELFAEPIIKQLAEKYHKDAGQIILRFENQLGVIVLPKSTHEARIKSNLNIFDFELTADEMAEMEKLDKGHGSYNPEAAGTFERLSQYDVHAKD